jgi:hypothetical protein
VRPKTHTNANLAERRVRIQKLNGQMAHNLKKRLDTGIWLAT